MSSEIAKSLQFICDEKGLKYEIVLDALQTALAAAYRKDFGNKQQNIQVIFDPETGDMKVWDEKEVVEDMDEEDLLKDQEELAKRREEAHKAERDLSEEEMEGLMRFNPKTQIMITEAKTHDKKVKIGDTIKIDLEVPGDFGRMAAQTAKQVIIQKLREAERGNVFEDFKHQEKGIVQGVVQRRDRSGGFIIDLGKITGILPSSEMMPRERYNLGNRMRFYVLSVDMGTRGPEIILSRKDKRMVEVVFNQEIPEIASGEVIIKGIARDAGNRSKVSVFTEDESIDPIGSCIGQRGSRITTIIEELGGEKIDVIQYSDRAEDYIKQALSPAKVTSVKLNEEEKEAVAMVESDQFSLAIGRGGQNVRLAADLTDWKIKVQDLGGEKEISSDDDMDDVEKALQTKKEETSKVTEESAEEASVAEEEKEA
ncbi:MAG: transcription termination factor NusA [Candidatus Magasanikbacteria bacterium RIFOXYC12_FULL_33_11]|uniref:Transcription termination/antitermination protein NusA n=1 Tax=Candidatus Magasanikbacteria bacterium RIFOXYC12_FULL_33_11 TaxID=1798701 RepID=A0A1F6NNQ7_9BACT|nr:MAG: transcription termination factor NusA [Candidatus Magasanikbacteria bacterium RIFOXYC12_FULL_33_11]